MIKREFAACKIKEKRYYYADGVNHLTGLQWGIGMWFVGFILYNKVCDTNVIFPTEEKSWFIMYTFMKDNEKRYATR